MGSRSSGLSGCCPRTCFWRSWCCSSRETCSPRWRLATWPCWGTDRRADRGHVLAVPLGMLIGQHFGGFGTDAVPWLLMGVVDPATAPRHSTAGHAARPDAPALCFLRQHRGTQRRQRAGRLAVRAALRRRPGVRVAAVGQRRRRCPRACRRGGRVDTAAPDLSSACAACRRAAFPGRPPGAPPRRPTCRHPPPNAAIHFPGLYVFTSRACRKHLALPVKFNADSCAPPSSLKGKCNGYRRPASRTVKYRLIVSVTRERILNLSSFCALECQNMNFA